MQTQSFPVNFGSRFIIKNKKVTPEQRSAAKDLDANTKKLTATFRGQRLYSITCANGKDNDVIEFLRGLGLEYEKVSLEDTARALKSEAGKYGDEVARDFLAYYA